jgi:hypothetical protein
MLRATPCKSADEAVAFEAENHLMDRGRTDAEVALHVSLGRGPGGTCAHIRS